MADEQTSRSFRTVFSTGLRSIFTAAQTLQFKATVLVVLLTLSVAAAVAGYILKASTTVVRNQHRSQLVELAGLLSKAAESQWSTHDPTDLKRLARRVANGDPVQYVIITDAEGRVYASAQSRHVRVLNAVARQMDGGVPVPGQPVLWQPERGEALIDVVYPITTRISPDADADELDQPRGGATRLVGYVRMGMGANGWDRSIASRLDLVIGIGVLATMIVIPLGFLLVRRIVAPLDGLANAMHQFSQGDLNIRSQSRRNDEVGKLVNAFNAMADLHQETHDRLVTMNVDLERRVAQRTQQLRELASRDPLTGLFNRRHLNEMLNRRFAEAKRYNTDLSCIMIDLDDFKAINDAFGHQVGDEVLVLAASTINGELRAADMAARFGGDEFIAILPQTDGGNAQTLAGRIAEKFARELSERLPQVRTTLSMGIACVTTPDIEDPESLVRAADRSLYKAKATGKHRIVLVSDSV